MSAPSAENTQPAAIVVAVREFLDALPEKTGLAECIAEGRAVAQIVEPLGLPDRILAAVHAYPAYRDGMLASNSFQNNELKDIPRLCLGLAQLDQFSLPSHWQPGDALADKQSEALRKMLLAVVSDVRLVLVRIAEQVYRLRQAKQAPEAERQALAQEAREIYAPLANRLGIWQLKWELEGLEALVGGPDDFHGGPLQFCSDCEGRAARSAMMAYCVSKSAPARGRFWLETDQTQEESPWQTPPASTSW